MPNLPASSSFTGSAITEAQFKSAVTDLREFLATLLGTAGTQAAALAAIGAILNDTVARTSATSVVTTDRGKLFDCDGTWSLSLPAAATAGDGFAIAVRNSGAGTITIDPDGFELIDGASTVPLAAGESGLCVCTGSAWKTVSRVVTPDTTNALCGFYARTTAGTGLTANKPAEATKAYIVCIGAGGGGSDQYGAGGGGGYCAAYTAVTGDLAVTVGGGGNGTGNGGASSVSGGGITTLTASGGNAGVNGGGGGAASGGNVNITGTTAYKGLRSGFEGPIEVYVGGSAHGSAAGAANGAQPGAGGYTLGAAGAVFIWWYK